MLAALLLPVVLAACGAPQSGQYYSLQAPANWKTDVATPAARAETSAASAATPAARGETSAASAVTPAASSAPRRAAPGYRLQLEVMQVPVEVDRPQLVISTPREAPAVHVLNDSLWIAPLRDQLQEALLAEVSERLGVPETQGLPEHAEHRPTRRIVVRINRFDMRWAHSADLSASWTDRLEGTAPRLCHARLRQLAPVASVAALVQAQRSATRALALLIASAEGAPTNHLLGDTEALEFGCT